MSCKRWGSLLLMLTLVLTLLCGCQTQASGPEGEIDNLELPEIWKQELRQAAQLGIPVKKLKQDNISGKEYGALLDWFVSYAAPEHTEEWAAQYSAFRNSTEPLCRFDAMAGLFLAAQTVGGEYRGYDYAIGELMHGINHSWDEDYITWELFGGFTGEAYSCGSAGECVLDGACYYYNLGRVSAFSGEHPFALDPQTNSFTPHNKPTYAEAVLAIVRLISSANPEMFVAEPSAVELEYLQMADNARTAFYGDTTASSQVTGRIYYVSAQGSDKNDGLSPERAWATPQYALSQKLLPGDAVLLRRGDVWTIQPSEKEGLTESALVIPEGVTLGAWGEGERPVLQGAEEAANVPAFWELSYEENGVKIWKATQPMYYAPVIVLNDGEDWAMPILPGINGSAQYVFDDGSPFDVIVGLSKDVQFCSLLDLSGNGTATDVENGNVTGALYLRCDRGNPAEVYENISIPQTACGLWLQSEASIENIALRYFTCNGAVMDGYDGFSGQSASGCEVGWCGGLLKEYQENAEGIFIPTPAGGALQVSSTDISVTDSYFHHCGPFTLIVAVHTNQENPSAVIHYQNQRFADNLFEYCGTAVHMGDYADMEVPGMTGYITNFLFEDNLVMHSGMGWVREMLWRNSGSDAALSAFETNDSAIDNEGILLRNNVFYKSTFALFSLSDYHLDRTTPVNALPALSGNTYVQFASRPILQKNHSTQLYYPNAETVNNVLGDTTGTLVCIN